LLSQVPFREFSSIDEMRPLIVALLDAGIEVSGYWKNLDYSVIDARIKPGHRRFSSALFS